MIVYVVHMMPKHNSWKTLVAGDDGPMVNQVKKLFFTAETKNIYLCGQSSLLMGLVWLFISLY